MRVAIHEQLAGRGEGVESLARRAALSCPRSLVGDTSEKLSCGIPALTFKPVIRGDGDEPAADDLDVGGIGERQRTVAHTVVSRAAQGMSVHLPEQWGVLDFAGGTVVHINAGIAGLVACIMVGKRKGFGSQPLTPHNVPMTVIGASLLWVGWFGFNAGSAAAANGDAGMAALVTQIATAAGVLTWLGLEWIFSKKPTAVGGATGAVAGLVAITPASGSCGPMGAIIIGFASALGGYYCAIKLKHKLGYDDSLDVFGVHGVGGIIGALLTGICCFDVLGGFGGEHETMGAQFWAQFKSVGVTIVWSGVVSIATLFAIKATIGLRVDEADEERGLDQTSHGETGYTN
jgi:Amt family ammonium transporter